MAINKTGQNKLADKEAAEMFWECLRRRDDYQALYNAWEPLHTEFINAIPKFDYDSPECRKPRWAADRVADKIRAEWTLGPISIPNPGKPFASLDPNQQSGLSQPSKVKEITLNRKQMTPELGLQLRVAFMLHRTDCICHLPDDFEIKIIIPQNNSSRNRADILHFRKEMMAWDMRKANKSWHEIGRKLRLKIASSTKDKLITNARNYYNSADEKIKRCADMRGAI